LIDQKPLKFTNVLVHKINKKRSRVVELFDKEVNYALVDIDKTHVVYDTYDVTAFNIS